MEEFEDRLKFAEDLFFKDEWRSMYIKQYKIHIEQKLIDSKNVHMFLPELNTLIGKRVTIAEEKKRLDELRGILAQMRTLIESTEKSLPKDSEYLKWLNDSTIKHRFALLRRYIMEDWEYAYERHDCCMLKAREFCLEFVKNRVNCVKRYANLDQGVKE
jgi:hypothetical protein